MNEPVFMWHGKLRSGKKGPSPRIQAVPSSERFAISIRNDDLYIRIAMLSAELGMVHRLATRIDHEEWRQLRDWMIATKETAR